MSSNIEIYISELNVHLVDTRVGPKAEYKFSSNDKQVEYAMLPTEMLTLALHSLTRL